MRRVMLALLLLLVGLLARPALAEPWKIGVLIYRNTQATATLDGVVTTVNASMTDPEVAALKGAVVSFAARVGEWSEGTAPIAVAAPVVVTDPITAVDVLVRNGANDDAAYLRTQHVKKHLDALLASGSYDSVIVFWHAGSGTPSPTAFRTDVGDAEYLTHAGQQITYAVLALNAGVLTEPVRGEAIVHEWLHGVDDFYRGLGYQVPDADEAQALAYGYSDLNGDGTLGGYEEFYRDILRGRVVDEAEGEYTGASPAVWAAGTPRAPQFGVPLPAQLIAPLDGVCAGATPTLRWLGPIGPGIGYEVTIESIDGPPFGHTETVPTPYWTIPADLLPAGRRYRWRVSSVEQGIYSAEPDELWLVAGGSPAPPLIAPAGGPIAAEGIGALVTSAAPEVEIRYTLDGSTPGTTSDLVQGGEVAIVPPAQLRAVAFLPRCAAPSAVAAGDYTVAAPLLVTNNQDSGPGSLRSAIATANATPGRDVIGFAIPGLPPYAITLGSGLPAITDPIMIDGWSQPGFVDTPVIELYGGVAGVTDGLGLVAGNSVIRGLSITRFGGYGISLIGTTGGSIVQDCYVGVAPSGAAAGNSGIGIYVTSPANTIGWSADSRNLISGNGTWGIQIEGPAARDNVVAANYIGTNAAGTARLSNGYGGVLVINASDNRIGGSDPGDGNLVSGNGFSGNSGDGVALADAGAVRNAVLGNRIGTDASGGADLGNSRFGVNVSATSNGATGSQNVIGGVEPGAGNLISGNDGSGIALFSNFGAGGHSNRVLGNFIGTDVTGTLDLGNGGSGVVVSRITAIGPSPSYNVIGGVDPRARNVISGNTNDGVGIVGSSPGGNTVQGNYIGTDIEGIFPIPNGRSGVRLISLAAFNDGPTNNLVGGPSLAARNVISGNGESGVTLIGQATGAAGNRIQGNYIGVSATLGSTPGNGPDGVLITTTPFGGSAVANLIGGPGLGAANVIGGHSGAGVRIAGAGASGNVVQGNFVGVDPEGSPHANAGAGVQLEGPGNAVGGGVGAGNAIAHNGGPGVRVASGAGNFVLTNSIRDNVMLGIDLTGGNAGAVAPVLTSAVASLGTIVRGTLAGPPAAEYTIELFANDACDPSGAGEGARFLGSGPLVLDAGGAGEIAALVATTVDAADVITATATSELDGSTSEFSNCVAPGAGPPGDPDGDGFGPGDNCPARPGLDQADSGGVNSIAPDGHGDACQCGDLDDDGVVNTADTALYRAHLADPGSIPLLGEAALKCSVVGGDPAACDLLDVVVLRRALGGEVPQIAQVCEADTL